MMSSFLPIIAICGTTGVGKSKLAIELALHLTQSSLRWRRAKIINADSMQVYKGLDILSNKVPVKERQGVPHLLMDFKQPGEQYVVGEWVQDALKLIDEMHKNDELPIIVGGTSYWIQHLIFPNRLVSKDVDDVPQQPLREQWSQELLHSIASLPSELLYLFENLPPEAPSAKVYPDEAFNLHQLLSILDPKVSQRWHWKDTRKVLRNLNIIKESGKRPSDIIMQQSSSTTDNKPRFVWFPTLCFWLYAEPSELGDRLDSRVDEMILQGLVDEVVSLRQIADISPSTTSMDEEVAVKMDYTVGIYQSIGYREFCQYLDAPTESSYNAAVSRMKISTKQYAKRQISWIRNKLIPAINATTETERRVHMYLLDATVLGNDWSKNVLLPATEITDAFLSLEKLPSPKSLSDRASKLLDVSNKDVDPTSVLDARKRRICSVCTIQEDRPIMIEDGAEWDIHRNTDKHRRLAAKRSRDVDFGRFPASDAV